MNNNTSKSQPKDEGLVSPGFRQILKGLLLLSILMFAFYIHFKPKTHRASSAQVGNTNQVSEVATAAPEPWEAFTNTPPQVEVAVSAIETNKTLPMVVNTNPVKHITFRIKPQFGKDPALTAGNNTNSNMTVQNTVQN